MIIISRVPSNLVDRTSDRTASSSITVPKFLIMLTSPSARPSICSMPVSRGSAQVTIAILGAWRLPAGGIVAASVGRIGAQRLVNQTHDPSSPGGPALPRPGPSRVTSPPPAAHRCARPQPASPPQQREPLRPLRIGGVNALAHHSGALGRVGGHLGIGGIRGPPAGAPRVTGRCRDTARTATPSPASCAAGALPAWPVPNPTCSRASVMTRVLSLSLQ